MKCPHCLVAFHDHAKLTPLGSDITGGWYIIGYTCPNPDCKKNIYLLAQGNYIPQQNGQISAQELPKSKVFIYPKGSNRPTVPKEVTEAIANDYTEACLVLNDSAKASAALGRRCLQNLLVEKAGVTKGDLSKQIQQVLDSCKLPSHLEDSIDAIRNIGNFAAHPNKSISTGEILEVEPHEAEWTLDVLEDLFDFYYVQPHRVKARKAALDAKLADSGKPPMK